MIDARGDDAGGLTALLGLVVLYRDAQSSG